MIFFRPLKRRRCLFKLIYTICAIAIISPLYMVYGPLLGDKTVEDNFRQLLHFRSGTVNPDEQQVPDFTNRSQYPVKYVRVNRENAHDPLRPNEYFQFDGDGDEPNPKRTIVDFKGPLRQFGIEDDMYTISQVPRYIELKYDQFYIKEPKFISEKQRNIFYNDTSNLDELGPRTPEKLLGEIYVVKNGSFRQPFECGYKSNVSYMSERRSSGGGFVKYVPVLCPLVVPMAHLYQHFIDGTLPKLIQAYEVLRIPSVKILLDYPHKGSTIIYQLLERLNIPEEKIVWHSGSTTYITDYIISTCNTPPLHPVLWRGLRKILTYTETKSPVTRDKVVLLTRIKAHSTGRRQIVNRNEVISALKSRYKHVAVLEEGIGDLEEGATFYRNVKTIIGVHGGAYYNMLFAPDGLNVVEYIPIDDSLTITHNLAHNIFWLQSELVGFNYWRMHARVENEEGDIFVDVGELMKTLDRIDHAEDIA